MSSNPDIKWAGFEQVENTCPACTQKYQVKNYYLDKDNIIIMASYADCDCGYIQIYNTPTVFKVTDKAAREALCITNKGLQFEWCPGFLPRARDLKGITLTGRNVALTERCANRIAETKIIAINNEDITRY